MTDPTTHPEELLAGYVDGDLAGDERTVLETHLASCGRCREEVRLARRARGALGALPEADVPVGTLRPVARSIAERTQPAAPGPDSRTGRRDRQRHDPTRVLAGLAIAAVLVVVGGIVVAPLLRGGGSSGSSIEAAVPRAQDVRSAAKVDVSRLPSPSVRRQSVDYDSESIQAVAQAAAQDPVHYARASSQDYGAASGGGASGGGAAPSATAAAEPSPAPSPAQGAFGPADNAAGSTAQQHVPKSEAKSVSRCVAQWSRGKGIVQKDLYPLRIIEATYQGQPATIAVYLQTRGRKTPAKVLIWVLNSDCSLVSFVQRAL